MCVIVVAETSFPAYDDLKLFELANGDGAGVAWREDGIVHWRKNLKASEIEAQRGKSLRPFCALPPRRVERGRDFQFSPNSFQRLCTLKTVSPRTTKSPR